MSNWWPFFFQSVRYIWLDLKLMPILLTSSQYWWTFDQYRAKITTYRILSIWLVYKYPCTSVKSIKIFDIQANEFGLDYFYSVPIHLKSTCMTKLFNRQKNGHKRSPITSSRVSLQVSLYFLLICVWQTLTIPGLEVIKLEYSLKFKIKRNDWLLADTL